jgi:DNA modification methylase
LRDYGEQGQLGLEETPEKYVANMVKVFSEVKRVLTKDGTLWLNLGDSYCGTGHKGDHVDPKHREGRNGQKVAINNKIKGLKSKDLVGIPWRVAFALQADGWYLRQDIIWHKPNPMPESVTDRCTKSHEYIFLLSKSPKYYYDHEAIKEPSIYAGDDRGSRTDSRRGTSMNSVSGITPDMKNKRSVWTVNTKPYPEAHFATFPKKLIRPCIHAGCPKGGVVLDPFGGSGTTAEVANELQRDAILCELSPEYCELIEKRLSLTQMEIFV